MKDESKAPVPQPRHLVVGVIVLLAALACNFPLQPGPQETPVVSPAPTTERSTAPPAERPTEQPTATDPSATPTATPSPSSTEGPLFWFAPLPPMPTREGRPFVGSEDYMDLFAQSAPWDTAAGHVDVFKLYGEWVAYHATTAQLRQVVQDVERRGMALAFEAGPLPTEPVCGGGVPPEGFAGIGEGLQIARRIEAVGGTVDYLAFDEPASFGHLYDGPHACHWELERIAEEAYRYVEAIRTVFPGVVVGDIEPLWNDAGLDVYKRWIETYAEVAGEPPAFFHLDVQWSRATWPEDARELETFARSRGVDFGMMYFGDREDTSDRVWLNKAEARMVTYEASGGGRPEHVLLQSWHDHPDRVLPETAPNTFTHLINRYHRPRSELSLSIESAGSSGGYVASGVLVDEGGDPLYERSLDYAVAPQTGAGVYGEYVADGEVPQGATTADVGFRVNTECGCSGAADFSLYEARYVEGESGANRVPNGGFGAGQSGWGFWGEGNAALEASDRGPGSMLRVQATPGQVAAINSTRFDVSAGASFRVTFGARVSPQSVGSGYFSLIFLGPDGEVSRRRIDLEPSLAASGTVTTGANGEFEFSLEEIPAGAAAVEVSFAGDESAWPATSRDVVSGP